jgi:hypothetical protein
VFVNTVFNREILRIPSSPLLLATKLQQAIFGCSNKPSVPEFTYKNEAINQPAELTQKIYANRNSLTISTF